MFDRQVNDSDDELEYSTAGRSTPQDERVSAAAAAGSSGSGDAASDSEEVESEEVTSGFGDDHLLGRSMELPSSYVLKAAEALAAGRQLAAVGGGLAGGCKNGGVAR